MVATLKMLGGQGFPPCKGRRQAVLSLVLIICMFACRRAAGQTIRNHKPLRPRDKRSTSFSYDPNSSVGPQKWEDVSVSGSDYFQWIGKRRNECGARGKQSPIVVQSKDECKDDHTPGDFRGRADFGTLKFEIGPTALKAHIHESGAPCLDWSNLSPCEDAVRVDVKLKSEHHLFGKSYAGEMTLIHGFGSKKKLINVGIMMDDSDDIENEPLEQFIREWEEVAWKRKHECDIKNGVIDPAAYIRTYPSKLPPAEMDRIWGENYYKEKSNYNLYRFFPTGWYCTYDGSITEPPCSKRVHWRILDLPMKMSKSQHHRMKELLTNRLNENCEAETAAYNGHVNRPIQPTKQTVRCCTSKNWPMREKDPKFWFDSWPEDYHGWDGCDFDGCRKPLTL